MWETGNLLSAYPEAKQSPSSLECTIKIIDETFLENFDGTRFNPFQLSNLEQIICFITYTT